LTEEFNSNNKKKGRSYLNTGVNRIDEMKSCLPLLLYAINLFNIVAVSSAEVLGFVFIYHIYLLDRQLANSLEMTSRKEHRVRQLGPLFVWEGEEENNNRLLQSDITTNNTTDDTTPTTAASTSARRRRRRLSSKEAEESDVKNESKSPSSPIAVVADKSGSSSASRRRKKDTKISQLDSEDYNNELKAEIELERARLNEKENVRAALLDSEPACRAAMKPLRERSERDKLILQGFIKTVSALSPVSKHQDMLEELVNHISLRW